MNSTLLNVPVGTVIDYVGNSVPSGYLECDGRAVSRTTYKSLFDAIGTAWGAGDGSTTFNLPNLQGRTTIGVGTGHALASSGGSETHTLTTDELPTHTHSLSNHTHTPAGAQRWFSTHMPKQGITGTFSFRLVANSTNKIYYLIATTNTDSPYDQIGANQFTSGPSNNTSGEAGGGSAHSIMQPYATVRKLIRAA